MASTQTASKTSSSTKNGSTIRITISKNITRASARMTIERLFMSDKSVAKPLNVRSANFVELPKRRGGCIWTKRCNKLHPELVKGESASILATPQHLRDLQSVKDFVEIA